MKSLKKIIAEEVAIKRINEAGEDYVDGMDADISTVAEYLVDAVEGNLNDTLALKDFFIRNNITDPQKKKKILTAANKIIKGK
jgi:hypothetical protein